MQHHQYDVQTHREKDRTYYTVEKITRPQLSQVLMCEVVLKYNKLQLWIRFGLHLSDKEIQDTLTHGVQQNAETDEELIEVFNQAIETITRVQLDQVVWTRLKNDYTWTPTQEKIGGSVITEVLQNGKILKKLRPFMMWRRTGRPHGSISVYSAELTAKPSPHPDTAKAAQFLKDGMTFKLKQNQAAGAVAPIPAPP